MEHTPSWFLDVKLAAFFGGFSNVLIADYVYSPGSYVVRVVPYTPRPILVMLERERDGGGRERDYI